MVEPTLAVRVIKYDGKKPHMPREIMPDNKFVVSRERHFLVYHNGIIFWLLS